MLRTDKTPIDIFVSQEMQSGQVLELINGWRIESEELHRIVVNNFRDMGIHFVHPLQVKQMSSEVLFHLAHSPEIVARNKRAEQEEAQKRRSRHAEV